MNNRSEDSNLWRALAIALMVMAALAGFVGLLYWLNDSANQATQAQLMRQPQCFSTAGAALRRAGPDEQTGVVPPPPGCNMDVGTLRAHLAQQDKRIDSLTFTNDGYVTVDLNGGNTRSRVYLSGNPGLTNTLTDLAAQAGVQVGFAPPPPANEVGTFLRGMGTPVLFMAGLLLIIFILQQRGAFNNGGNKAMTFGKSRARRREGSKVTFADVAGIDEAKADLQEIVEYLRNPLKFQRLGGKIPRGVLLVGPPGTGKTLMARAIAGEASTDNRQVPFYTVSGSDFVEMFVGVGASRVRDMFEQAKQNAPCIIFIDEIDAVGRHRGAGLGGGNDEREQTLNQLLVEMDGFEQNDGVILIAATNRPDVLDPALLRPGRFDRQVEVPNPDIDGREQILKVHVKKIPLAREVNLRTIARGTPGFSGADLMNLANEAALLAARRGLKAVGMKEFEDSKDKVMVGAARKNTLANMTPAERLLTAYHEGAHTLVMVEAEGHTPLHKVTIVPRGRTLGAAWFLPVRDKYSQSKREMRAHLESLYAGRLGEQLLVGPDDITSGAKGDYMQATKLCREYVMENGFDEHLPPLAYTANEQEVFLGKSVAKRQEMSDETARRIDKAIQDLATERNGAAFDRVQKGKAKLIAIAEAVNAAETLTADEVRAICAGVEQVLSTSNAKTLLEGDFSIEEFAKLGEAVRAHAEELAKLFDNKPDSDVVLAACESFGAQAARSIIEALPERLKGAVHAAAPVLAAAAKAQGRVSRIPTALRKLALRVLGDAA